MERSIIGTVLLMTLFSALNTRCLILGLERRRLLSSRHTHSSDKGGTFKCVHKAFFVARRVVESKSSCPDAHHDNGDSGKVRVRILRAREREEISGYREFDSRATQGVVWCPWDQPSASGSAIRIQSSTCPPMLPPYQRHAQMLVGGGHPSKPKIFFALGHSAPPEPRTQDPEHQAKVVETGNTHLHYRTITLYIIT